MPAWNARSNPQRYQRLPGTARRFRDRVNGEELSYDAYYQRTRGERRSDVAAIRKGYQSAAERRSFASRNPARPGVLGPVTYGGRVSQARALRRRSSLAESWGEYQRLQGASVVTTKSSRKRDRGVERVNISWALQQPEFQGLEALLAQQSVAIRRDNLVVDPRRAPNGELAIILEQLGRRPVGATWAVGDSPPGTAKATMDVLRNGG